MKHALVVVALASTFTFFTKPAEKAAADGALAVEVQCEPSSRNRIQLLRRPTETSYNCSAYVFEADNSSRSVARAHVVVEAGERQTETRKTDDTNMTFTVAISRAHDRAATEVVVTKAGRTVLRQKSDVVLLSAQRP
ncbi:MAG TPA: hypothetical protein VEK11_06830 [Thermoanaerobaculia bacterium]|jgi:hypothetical protein|nr:hypothetical protein [Thermoanaerobaculia bacterium]